MGPELKKCCFLTQYYNNAESGGLFTSILEIQHTLQNEKLNIQQRNFKRNYNISFYCAGPCFWSLWWMFDSVVLAWLAQFRQLAQHSMPAVVSVVAAISAFRSASVKKLLLSFPLPSLWVVKSENSSVCISGCLLVCVLVCLRYFLNQGRGWYVVLITKSKHRSVQFCE